MSFNFEGAEPAIFPVVAYEEDVTTGSAPWRVALTRLVNNRPAVAAITALLLIILACAFAPVYAAHIANTDPFSSNLAGTITVAGQSVPVIQPNSSGLGSTPIGPTWTAHYFLGSDTQGRDVAARLLYAGRTSLIVGVSAALITALLATLIGLIAGFYRGWVDASISRLLDLVWAFPIYLLAIALSTVLLLNGISIGPISIDPTSLWLPTLIIAGVYIPYVARPIRGEVLVLRQREFIESAIGQGAPTWKILISELLPNIIPTVIVFLPLMTATDMLTEASLSFLSIGVQAPNASWGTMISDGAAQLYTRPLVSIAPGVLLSLTIVLLNIVADSVRTAIDPRGVRPRLRRRRSRPGSRTLTT